MFKMSFFYWRRVVDSGTWLCQVQQKSNEIQVRYTLKKLHRVFISRGVHNGWAFKMINVWLCLVQQTRPVEHNTERFTVASQGLCLCL